MESLSISELPSGRSSLLYVGGNNMASRPRHIDRRSRAENLIIPPNKS